MGYILWCGDGCELKIAEDMVDLKLEQRRGLKNVLGSRYTC